MKNKYIAPEISIIKLGDDLCTLGLNAGSNHEDKTTPGNDTQLPETDGPGFGGDTGEEPA